MIDCDRRTQVQPGTYQAPTLDELISIGQLLGLVGGIEQSVVGVRLQLVGQVFAMSEVEAKAMLNGMLLGYFAATNGEELTAAQWR